jgi:hypothetical protein
LCEDPVVGRAVLCTVVVAACSFRHGALTSTDDATSAGDAAHVSDARPVDGRMLDGPPDARVCPAAPSGCSLFTCATTSSCYYICSATKKSWSSANTACAAITSGASTGCLATINDQDEQDCIVTATVPMFANSNWVWFGFVQAPGAAEPAGGWGWNRTTSAATRTAGR